MTSIQGVQVCVCIYFGPQRWVGVFVTLFLFVFADIADFSDQWNHSHPACGYGVECGRPGGSLHCGSIYECTSLKRVGAMQQGERRESKRTSTGKKPSPSQKTV